MTQQTSRASTDVDAAIGSRIKTRRLELNLSQKAIGDALGVRFQQVQKYEDGTNRLSANRLPILAELLQVDVGYFFDSFDATAAPNGDGGIIAEQLKRAVVIRLMKACQGCGDRLVAAACAMIEAIRKETRDADG